MIEFSLFILSAGISLSLLFFSTSFSYKIFSEISLKKNSLDRNSEKHHQIIDHDKLTQKLEKYQSETFGKSLIHPSERTRMIAARIREEESKGGGKNAN